LTQSWPHPEATAWSAQLQEQQAASFCTCGLSWLQNWVIHRDLKPSNILVMGEGPEQVLGCPLGWRLPSQQRRLH
jgi:serine/threonine protein kinase